MWQKIAVRAAKYAPLVLENPVVLVEMLPVAVGIGAVALVVKILDK